MKTLMVTVLGLGLLLAAGCGVNKDYVQEQVSESEARMTEQMGQLESDVNANEEQIAQLQSLSQELSKKTDMAINQAKGFENYQIIWEGTINFAFDQFEITATAEEILLEACEKMEQTPSSVVEIAGHTDRTGSARYNVLLGEMRANAAKRFLSDRCGMSLYRLFIVSHGENKPAAMSDEREAASKNRRVSLTIWGPTM